MAMNVVWTVSIGSPQVYPNWDESISGNLRGTDGSYVPYPSFYFYRKSPSQTVFQQFSPNYQSGETGWFQVLGFNAGTEVGVWTIRIQFTGVTGYNPSTYDVTYEILPGVEKQDVTLLCNMTPPLNTSVPITIGCAAMKVIGGQALGEDISVDVYWKTHISGVWIPLTTATLPGDAGPWYYGFNPTTQGVYDIRFQFNGNDNFNPAYCTTSFTYGNCTEERYELCPDGSTIMTDQCMNGVYVPTGETCPEVVATLECFIVSEATGGVVKPDEQVVYGCSARLSDGTWVNPTIHVSIKSPDGTSTPLSDINASSQGHYTTLNAVGDWVIFFKLDAGYDGTTGLTFLPRICSASIQCVPCWLDEVKDAVQCYDGTTIYQKRCNIEYQWVDTGLTCPIPPCLDTDAPKCVDGVLYHCNNGVWVSSVPPEPCGGETSNLLLLGAGIAGAVGLALVFGRRRESG